MVSHSSTQDFLAQHKLVDVCGIGEKNRRRLQRLGIFTILDFIHYPSENLIRLCGKDLYLLQMGLQGFECSAIQGTAAEAPKSVGHSYCVPKAVNKEGNVLPVFMKMVEKAGKRMRDLQRQAGSVSVSVSFSAAKTSTPTDPVFFLRRFDGDAASHRFGEPVSDSFSLVDASLKLLDQLWDGTREISFLAVTFHDLRPVRAQGIIDYRGTSWQASPKRERVSQAMDKVRDRYGNDSILFGQMAKLTNEMPDRIGFRKVEGIELVSSSS
jgi:DNA polymerase-4